jgi:uncharacterized integral membrane protein
MRSLRKVLEIVLIAVLLGAFALFAVQNGQTTTLKFLQWQTLEIPLFLVILISFFAGILVTTIVMAADVFRHHRQRRQAEKKVKALEQQLTLMKQQPLLDNFSTMRSDEPENQLGDDDADEVRIRPPYLRDTR